MLVTVKRDGGAFPLHGAHLLPEMLIERGRSQIAVVGIRDYGENRANSKLLHEVSYAGPVFLAHRGAKVVDPKQVLRGSGKSLHHSRLRAFLLAASCIRDRRKVDYAASALVSSR